MITSVTDSTYEQEIKNFTGRILIDFYTPTCPPCRAMAPTLEEISNEQPALKIVKVDASTEGEIAAEFGVSAVPTFVLMENGTEKAQIKGLRSKKDFEKWLSDN